MAEREGFEPSVPVKVRIISNDVHSATLSPFHRCESMGDLRKHRGRFGQILRCVSAGRQVRFMRVVVKPALGNSGSEWSPARYSVGAVPTNESPVGLLLVIDMLQT